LRSPLKLFEAARMRLDLRCVPYKLGCWPTAAHGEERVEAVTLTDGRKSWDEPCDYLACGFGLVANTELPRLLGCATRERFVVVDEYQRTTVEEIYCAGEATGVGGLGKSLVEGEIAGLCATGQIERARGLFRARRRAFAFVSSLDRAFSLRAELKALPRSETIVCRCEDVTVGSVSTYASARAAKLHTRCGMGPCQGRICGPALEFLLGWQADSVRPPVFPAWLGTLANGASVSRT
jgi:NAD(P)H-nitrite reductase large subunit